MKSVLVNGQRKTKLEMAYGVWKKLLNDLVYHYQFSTYHGHVKHYKLIVVLFFPYR